MRAATTILLAAVLAAPAAQAAKRPPAFTFGLSKAGDQLVLKAPGYRLALDRVTGAIAGLTARPSGARLVTGESGCLWSAETAGGADADGCPQSAVAYRWSLPTRTLTLTYPSATVTIAAGASSLDLGLTLDNQTGSTLQSVGFPADLLELSGVVKAGYVPTYLPGLRL